MRGRLNWTAARFINLLSRQKAADGQQEVLNKSQESEREREGEREMGEKERWGVAVLSVKSNKILAHVPHTPTKRKGARGACAELGEDGGNFADGWWNCFTALPNIMCGTPQSSVPELGAGGNRERAVEFRKMRARHSSRRWCCKATARNEVATRVLQTNWNEFNYNCYKVKNI